MKPIDWDGYWEDHPLPDEARPESSLYLAEILGVFERYLPPGEGRTAIEVGGAPGRFAAYLHRRLGYSVEVLERSDVGVRKTEENFALLGIPGAVRRGDVLDPALPLPRYDVVFSLGLIEHFEDPTAVVAAHVRLLAPGGYLVLGVPGLLGINGFFLRRVAPELYAGHNVEVMRIKRWPTLTPLRDLQTVFLGYVGGFEPQVFADPEPGVSPLARATASAAGLAARVLNRPSLRPLRRVNAPWLSGYAMGVFRA